MECCANCFGDRGLSDQIAFQSKVKGDCSRCGAPQVALIDPCELADQFAALMSVYEQDASGKPLVQWLKEDWCLFPEMNDATAQVLLGDILDDGQVVRKPFIPSRQYASDTLGQWEDLCQELLHRNRYFPKTTIDLERLESLLSSLTIDSGTTPRTWYRARIQHGDEAFDAADMQAPPPGKASHGRANPAGIPYLYLASSINTAICEVRPHPGEIVSIAEFKTPKDLKFVDLRSPRATVSPFLLEDEEEVGLMRSDLTFLERLGDELTRPVLPHAAAYDYTPSQYICEFIKKCGYAGVIYRSSVSDGINLALFQPETAAIGAIQKHRVKRVAVEAELSK